MEQVLTSAVLLGVPGLVVGLPLAWAVGRVPHSAWFVAALGLLLAALFVSTAAATSGESCDPCSEIGGQWFHAIALSLAGSNLFGWLLGTIAGAALARRARSS